MKRESSKRQLHDVTGCTFVRDYLLKVRFDDETERIIDFEPILLGPLFGPLRDPQMFRQVSVDADMGTLVWPTGADIEPGVLYDWPEHVDAIIRRRQQRWAPDYIDQHSRQSGSQESGSALQRVAEANTEPYESNGLPEES